MGSGAWCSNRCSNSIKVLRSVQGVPTLKNVYFKIESIKKMYLFFFLCLDKNLFIFNLCVDISEFSYLLYLYLDQFLVVRYLHLYLDGKKVQFII